jgi:hypothetical protein
VEYLYPHSQKLAASERVSGYSRYICQDTQKIVSGHSGQRPGDLPLVKGNPDTPGIYPDTPNIVPRYSGHRLRDSSFGRDTLKNIILKWFLWLTSIYIGLLSTSSKSKLADKSSSYSTGFLYSKIK